LPPNSNQANQLKLKKIKIPEKTNEDSSELPNETVDIPVVTSAATATTTTSMAAPALPAPAIVDVRKQPLPFHNISDQDLIIRQDLLLLSQNSVMPKVVIYLVVTWGRAT
jgi:hypothetical protein